MKCFYNLGARLLLQDGHLRLLSDAFNAVFKKIKLVQTGRLKSALLF